MEAKELRKKIYDLVAKYYTEHHRPELFVPGKTRIPYAGRVYDEKEMNLLVSSALDFWLTAGPYAEKLEKSFKGFFNAKKFYSLYEFLYMFDFCSPMQFW